MRKTLLTLFTILICISAAFSQAKNDSIVVKKGFMQTVYVSHKNKLTYRELINQLSEDRSTRIEVKKARVNNTFSTIIGGAGGFATGFYLGNSMGGGNLDNSILFGGVALIACSIPFEIGKYKHLNKAVSIYNKGLHKVSMHRWQGNVHIAANSIGLTINY